MRRLKLTTILLFLLVFLASCTFHTEADYIQTADSLLWADPDSCITYCQQIEHIKRNTYECNRIRLIHQHAIFKIADIESDSILNELSDYFIRNRYYQEASEANYILGAHYVQLGDFLEATTHLKAAERLYKKTPQTNPLLEGMLYFNFAVASEQCRIYKVTMEYCQLALPLLKETQKNIYIAVCYHLLGKCYFDQETRMTHLDSALHYAKKAENPIVTKEVEVTRYQTIGQNLHEKEILNIYRFLCDSCQQYSYAAEITDWLIVNNELSAAEIYLNKLTQDTSINIWSKEMYFSLTADMYWASGRKWDAYETLKHLHTWQTEKIEQSAFANMYIISQRFDASHEKEMRLQETIKRQRAEIWFFACLLLAGIISGFTYNIYKKGQFQLRISEEQKKVLKQELETNRAVLRAKIKERVEVAKGIRFWGSHHSEPIPKILNILSPTQAAIDNENWKNFYNDFNLCYNNLLARMSEQYPTLTDADLQYIALTYMGFDTTDMSFLLSIEKRTIWNRRNAVKQHMNMPEETNLDEWIITRE